MAKRLYDSMKFDDPWYRKLSPVHKCFWEFLLCKCDHAGIWKVDLESASWNIGQQVSAEDLAAFNGRITVLNGGVEWFIPKFIMFQQKISNLNELNPTNKCHQSIIKLLSSRSLVSPKKAPKKGLRSSYGIGIGIGKGKDGQHNSVFDGLWEKYPRKLGKPEAFKHFSRTVITEEDQNNINRAIENFLESRQANGDPKFIPYGSTWFNNWQDWVNYQEPEEVKHEKWENS